MPDANRNSNDTPQLLSYASSAAPRPQIFSLLAGILMGIFFLLISLIPLFIAVVMMNVGANDRAIWEKPFIIVLLVAIGGFFVVCGLIQLIAIFSAMWFPTRAFWWDKFFVTIGRHREKIDP